MREFPSHGLQGGLHSTFNLNFALGVNDRSPRPYQCFGFGSQSRVPLSPVHPRQGGVRNSASYVCGGNWNKIKEAQNAEQKTEGFGRQATRAEGPSVKPESETDDEFKLLSSLEVLISDEHFSDWIDGRLYNHMPPACNVAWKGSQQAWLDLAINNPIILNKGECSVHVLGVFHRVPTNASALRALVEAVQPDTIAIEQPPQSSKRFRAVAQELAPQLDKLMALEFPVGIREAHMALSLQERCRSRQVIFEGELAFKRGPEFTSDKVELLVYGSVPGIEWLTAARLVPSGHDGISLEGIDLEARTKENRLLEDPEFEQEYMHQLLQLLGPSNIFQGNDPAFAEWQKTVANMEPLKHRMPLGWEKFIDILGFVSMSSADEDGSSPSLIPKEVVSRMTGKAAVYAQTLGNTRNLAMLDCLQQLAEGRWLADGPLRPRKCIVAVVGQSHVAPMLELAARNKM